MGNNPYGLFEVTGIEAEYMIADKNSLAVMPAADAVFFDQSGEYISDFRNGDVEWSNELVNHVMEIKTAEPVRSLSGVDESFAANIRKINGLLEKRGAFLLPTASHPFMDPLHETVLWPHEYAEIYKIFDSVFSCRSHGWANLQSIHINLPFKNDEEFGRLHAAIRILLPLVPCIAASSPFREGKITGFLDSRMESYFYHERKIPSLMGRLIPEPVFSEEEYYDKIFKPIISDFKKYDPEHVMEHHFLNSRGAIARFDRGAIEIRVMDIQECPLADMAAAEAVIQAAKILVSEKYISYREQKKADTENLLSIFMESIKTGLNTQVTDSHFLSCFGLKGPSFTMKNIWEKIFKDAGPHMNKTYADAFLMILERGSLSERILAACRNPDKENITETYRRIGSCASDNKMFFP